MTKQTKQTNESNEPQQTNKLQFRHAYSPQLRVSIKFKGSGLTKQEFKDESDINQIMARYMRTGLIDNVTNKLPQFQDLDGQTFTDAMQIVAESKSLFADLPSSIRNEFENNPAKFLDFVHDPENRPRMAEMGLLNEEATNTYLSTNPTQTNQPNPIKTNPRIDSGQRSESSEPPKAE